ncbi:MAG TPA: UDP-glucose/GDP-mannose dehydrogenase family protein [Fimbriimonadaceae bacterium]|nr:UDP-glucose/GDP-mannose dehydrogenase family protein [Fimbriimonadaceae bacterium]
MKVAVIGSGYVGLVTGVVLADMGNQVTGVDNDPQKLAQLRAGISPIYEPGLEEILKRTLQEGNITFTDSIKDAVEQCEVVFIAVGTPPAADGSPDLSAVKSVACSIASGIKSYTVVVNKSTVPVGSGGLVEGIIREAGVPEDMFDVVSNPEFLREGSAIRDTLEADRIVIGAKRREAAMKLVELYAPLERPMHITDLASAELIKYASNSFLAMKISFINAISRICELCGADVGDVAKGVAADKRISPLFLQPGLGWGGSCFPKDVQGLYKVSEDLGYDFRLLGEVIEINDSQTSNFMDRLSKRLGGFAGKHIALMGLAFKPNTDDIRYAKSLDIIERVLSEGGTVRAYDPVAADNVREVYPNIQYTDHLYEVAEGADALILVTEWNEFRQADLARLRATMRQPILFDGRRIYSPAIAAKAGLEYYTIGVANSS